MKVYVYYDHINVLVIDVLLYNLFFLELFVDFKF